MSGNDSFPLLFKSRCLGDSDDYCVKCVGGGYTGGKGRGRGITIGNQIVVVKMFSFILHDRNCARRCIISV
jgi:hypothetical protein